MSTPPLSNEHARTPTIDITNVDFVPEELPPSADAPLKARPVGFFAALFGYWLFADRWGPHLAAGSHLRALIAYLIHFFIISACGLATFLLRSSGDIHSITDLRQAVANLILMLMTEFRLNVAQQIGIILAPLSLLLSLLALSFLTAPWAAQGDTFRSAWSRTFKSMLWSMSVFSLTAVLLMVGYWMTATVFNGDVRIYTITDPFSGVTIGENGDYRPEIVGIGLAVLIFARAAWAGMRRYVGPAVGPGFEPRHPLCHTCSYPIVGLPMTGICPECQTPVQNSLPDQPLYSHDELKQALSVSHPMKYLRFSRHLVGQPEILKLLPVRNAQLGVRYWQATYALSALLGLALAAALAIAPFTTEPTIALGMFGAWSSASQATRPAIGGRITSGCFFS